MTLVYVIKIFTFAVSVSWLVAGTEVKKNDYGH